MNTVTFETAKALKDAGFPQPEPAPGQFWYHESGGHIKYLFAKRRNDFLCAFQGGTSVRSVEEFQFMIFAPTATDILEQLPGAIITFEKYWEVLYFTKCKSLARWKNGNLIANLPDPHEAAAKAFLELKKAENEIPI